VSPQRVARFVVDVWHRYTPYVVLAVVLGIALAFGSCEAQRNADRNAEGLRRDRIENLRALHAECLSTLAAIQSNRDLLRGLVDDPIPPIRIPTDADEALRTLIIEANERAVANQKRTLAEIDASPIPNCSKSERALDRALRQIRG
jgi:hypothetical protein